MSVPKRVVIFYFLFLRGNSSVIPMLYVRNKPCRAKFHVSGRKMKNCDTSPATFTQPRNSEKQYFQSVNSGNIAHPYKSKYKSVQTVI